MSKSSSELKREKKLRKAAQRQAALSPHEAPTTLRLVRSENEAVPAVEDAPRQPDPRVETVPEQSGPVAARGEEETERVLVSPTDPGPRKFVEIELVRTVDADSVNKILNDPSVFPNISVPGMEHIDIGPVLEEPNICLMAEGCAILFTWYEPGVYEVHANFLGSHRGNYVLDVSRAAARWMFGRTDCCVLLTKVPDFNKSAATAISALGWIKHFTREAAWPTKDGPVGMSYWMLPYLDWVRKTPELAVIGQEFHQLLEKEFERHGSKEEQHPDEDCHDRHVGACHEMLRHGQYEKAVSLYNGWARFAGYGCIGLASTNPVVLDIGNAVLQIKDGSFKVIRVK